MKHNREQQLYFLEAINTNFDNRFLKMELRSRKNGMDLSVKRYLDQAEYPEKDEETAKELLWTYNRAVPLNSENINNAVDDVNIVIESYEDSIVLVERLNNYLEELELPALN